MGGKNKGDEEERREKVAAADAKPMTPAEKAAEKLKQKYLPGQEPPPEIEEINEAFERHLDNRKRFQSATTAVNESKEVLKLLLKKHKRPFYRYDGHDAQLVVSEDFSIKAVKDEENKKDD